jgi:hypothetical protein
MAFLADDFGAWLVAVLSDTGRKKLAQLLTGTDEQGRALRWIATSAIRATAEELRPGNPQRAEHLARVIDELFKIPTREDSSDALTTAAEALEASIGVQLAVLDDASMTGVGSTAADELEISTVELTEKIYGHLRRQILFSGSRGGTLEPLANALHHETTQSELQEIRLAVRQIAVAVDDRLTRHAPDQAALDPGVPPFENVALYVEQLLSSLELGDHDEAERRMNRLFIPISRTAQRIVVEALFHEASTTEDHQTQALACSLLEAADRLDHSLVTLEQVEHWAGSPQDSLRMSAAMIRWQWAQDQPGTAPIPLLARLSLPSQENWYVQAPARAVAKTLLLHRAAARAVFDRLAASRDSDDRHTAALDLLDLAEREPRAVPADLARKLAKDRDPRVAAKGAELLHITTAISDRKRLNYYMPFGL